MRRTGAEERTQEFSCWEQFVAMSFCQLAQAKSLREIAARLACREGRLRHLGIEEAPTWWRRFTDFHRNRAVCRPTRVGA